MNPGPRTREQMTRLGSTWRQGEHVLISGPTGSGKTTLARQVIQQRINNGGFVAVFVGKLQEDKTLTDNYKGFTRWKRWKNRPGSGENKVLVWPDTDKFKKLPDKRKLQTEVYLEAFDKLSNTGKWCIQIDEGLYVCSPTFLNLAQPLAMLHNLGRSSGLTIVTLTQRPAHIPLVIYSAASHAFVGQTREDADRKRMAELGGIQSSKQLGQVISGLERQQFLWVPVTPGWDPEIVAFDQ